MLPAALFAMTVSTTPHRFVLGMRLDATSYDDATRHILEWATTRAHRYVCAANVHMVMECHDSDEFRAVVNDAGLITPDGVPLVWTLRRLGVPEQSRVYGPTLMLHVCAAAARAGVPVGLYGAGPEVLETLQRKLTERFPELDIAYAYSPPFRPLTAEEDEAVVSAIRDSGARILFVGLGCPRQERWMAEHQARLPLVMLGVGAAFDFHAGNVKQAPALLQTAGLEWLFRLTMEPKRLWRRYLKHNPRFIYLTAQQLWGERRKGATP